MKFDEKDRHLTDKIVRAIRDRYAATVYANRNSANYSEPTFPFNSRSFGPISTLTAQPLNETTVDLDTIYQAGNIAYGAGNLERAMELWNSLLLVNPSYQRGELRAQVRKIQPELFARLNSQIEQGQAEILNAQHKGAATLSDWEDLRDNIKKYEQVGYKNEDALRLVFKECIEQAARIGNWDKALLNLRDLERTFGLSRQAKRQRRAFEINRDAVPLYDQARLSAQAGQDDRIEKALRTLYAKAPAYGDPAGLVTQLARKRVAERETEREPIIRERQELDRQRKEKIARRPLLGRVQDFFSKSLPTPPPPLTQEAAEQEVQERVWPVPRRYFQPLAILDALKVSLLRVLRGIRTASLVPFFVFRESIWWGILVVLLVYGTLAGIIVAAINGLGAIRLLWILGALFVLIFLFVLTIELVSRLVRGYPPFEMKRPDNLERLFD